MDAMKTLPIKKHITLVKRLPETRFASRIDLQRANWIIFADYLSLTILTTLISIPEPTMP